MTYTIKYYTIKFQGWMKTGISNHWKTFLTRSEFMSKSWARGFMWACENWLWGLYAHPLYIWEEWSKLKGLEDLNKSMVQLYLFLIYPSMCRGRGTCSKSLNFHFYIFTLDSETTILLLGGFICSEAPTSSLSATSQNLYEIFRNKSWVL